MENDIQEILKQWQAASSLPFATPYGLPEYYFLNFEQALLERVEISDLEDTIYLMEKHHPIMAFHAPSGYFDTLENRIQQKINSEKPGKLKKLTWYKFAAAAAFAGIIAFGTARYFHQQHNNQPAAVTVTPVDIQKVNSRELAEFAEESAEGINNVATAKKTLDVNQLLDEVSNQDLQNFLNESSAGDNDMF
ncbi:hypothetical protein ABDK00_002655 [Niabella insulamsoli]|uniref:hypothetical protein n=1 Tax=Niabella insulamsoli TaxID=3144874 RepID=UPI0031FBD6AA